MDCRTPASITYITTLLVTPLVQTYSQEAVSTLKSTLERELLSIITPQTRDDATTGTVANWSIYLPLHPTQTPSLAILSACMASGVEWSDWIVHLGGAEVTFGVSHHAVVAHFPSTNIWTCLWQHPAPTSQEEESYAVDMCRKYTWWKPLSVFYTVDPECIPVSPPKSSFVWSAPGTAWRPDSPSKDSVWSDDDEEDDLEPWEREDEDPEDDWEWDYPLTMTTTQE